VIDGLCQIMAAGRPLEESREEEAPAALAAAAGAVPFLL